MSYGYSELQPCMCSNPGFYPCSYPARVKQYSSTILLKAGLDRYATYFWCITNRDGHELYGSALTSSAGITTINVPVLDAYSFNENAGPFVMEILDGNKRPVTLTIDGKQYNKVVMQFINISDPAGNLHNVIS